MEDLRVNYTRKWNFCICDTVLNVPKEVLYRVPDDGLSNQTDEDKLGVTYNEIASYINGEEVSEESKEKIKKLHKNSLHKFNIPTYIKEN